MFVHYLKRFAFVDYSAHEAQVPKAAKYKHFKHQFVLPTTSVHVVILIVHKSILLHVRRMNSTAHLNTSKAV